MTENQPQVKEKKTGPIGERLLKLIQFYHLNMNSLSIRLGLPSNSVITRIVKDAERGMSLDLIQKILFEFTEINPDWFVMGRGEMFIDKEKQNPEPNSGLLAQKDEMISNLKMVIKSKDEVISAKDDLIANINGRDSLRKQNVSG